MKPTRTCLFCTSFLLMFIGLFFMVISSFVLKLIIGSNLALTPDSKLAASWKYPTTLVPMDFYFFNWTNPKEIYNETVKPKFEELGPYRFMLRMTKSNITWNKNGTVTYGDQNYWYFDPEGTKGSLLDKVTTLNTPAARVAHGARSWNFIARKTISLSLRSIYPAIYETHTVDELLFSGYPDTLTQIASTLPISSDSLDKFGYFYKKNGTANVEGVLNVGTGVDSIFGKVYSWNHWSKLPYYEGDCGRIDGSNGLNFDLSSEHNWVELFLPNLCRPVRLESVGKSWVDGIPGIKYVIGDYGLDNGTKYPQKECFYPDESVPSGVFNVTMCRQGVPVFMSLPHFHNADPYYKNLVEGLQPIKEKHEFSIIIEPHTGIPLEIEGRLQINFLLNPVPNIALYDSVPKVFFPILWFGRKITVPKKQLPQLKLLLSIPTIIISLGGVVGIVGLALLIYLIVTMKKEKFLLRKEEDVPLRPELNHS